MCQMAPLAEVCYIFLLWVETGKQTYSEYLSEALIRRLAAAIDDDEEKLDRKRRDRHCIAMPHRV